MCLRVQTKKKERKNEKEKKLQIIWRTSITPYAADFFLKIFFLRNSGVNVGLLTSLENSTASLKRGERDAVKDADTAQREDGDDGIAHSHERRRRWIFYSTAAAADDGDDGEISAGQIRIKFCMLQTFYSTKIKIQKHFSPYA